MVGDGCDKKIFKNQIGLKGSVTRDGDLYQNKELEKLEQSG